MENQNKEKAANGWGGARKGAGRRKTSENVKTIGLCVPQDVVDILEAQANRSAYIIAAIREKAARDGE